MHAPDHANDTEMDRPVKLDSRARAVADDAAEVAQVAVSAGDDEQFSVSIPDGGPFLVIEFERDVSKPELKTVLREFDLTGRYDDDTVTVDLSEVRVAPHRLRRNATEAVRYVAFCDVVPDS